MRKKPIDHFVFVMPDKVVTITPKGVTTQDRGKAFEVDPYYLQKPPRIVHVETVKGWMSIDTVTGKKRLLKRKPRSV